MSRSFRIEGQELSTRFNDLVIGGGLVSDEAPADGQLMRYDAATGKWRPHDPSGGAGGLLTAVVDIGPTTNNGPGPNNVGVKNWSASPTIIVAHPGTGKFANFISGSVQYKPGSAAYADPNAGAKAVSLQYASSTTTLFMSAVPSNLGLDTLTAYNFPFVLGISGGSVGAASFPVLQSESEDKAIVIGFVPGSGALELTTGDGQVRVTVHYLIDNILT